MAQEIDSEPWGAQDRFQAHFIVKAQNPISDVSFLARTELETIGHFASKRVSRVEWVGGHLADKLNLDDELKSMISKLSYDDAHIYVEPTTNGIRIHGKWKDSYGFGITKELFAVYDKIASHIKRELGSPPV